MVDNVHTHTNTNIHRHRQTDGHTRTHTRTSMVLKWPSNITIPTVIIVAKMPITAKWNCIVFF